jgi:hypothetical protein
MNKSTTTLQAPLIMSPLSTAVAFAPGQSWNSQILNGGGVQVLDEYCQAPGGGSGPNPYTSLNFTHCVKGGTGSSFYTFDSPVIAPTIQAGALTVAGKSACLSDGTNCPTSYRETLATPASSTAPCTAGQFTDDVNYHYVCVATNTWKRVALSAF